MSARTMRQSIQLDPIDADSFPAFREAFGATFGESVTPEDSEASRAHVEYERFLAARDASGQIVGTAGAYSFELSLPGSASAPCAGVTVVSVRADHRRRGLLTQMMTRLLDEADARGEPFAALWASESEIYGRFGFGPAVPTVELELERPYARLRVDGPTTEVALIDEAAAHEAFPAIHERHRALRGGLMARSQAWWQRTLSDPPSRRADAGPLRYAVLGDRGFVTYRLKPAWRDGGPRGQVLVKDLVALDAATAAALWQFVIETDLASELRTVRRPPDDAILSLLADSGRAKLTVGEPLYVRLVDLPAALVARHYDVDDALVLQVSDRFRPANEGRWALAARAGAATCERTDAPADLTLDTEALATIALGGVRVSQLLHAGQIIGTRDAAARLGRLFATDLAPSSDIMF